MKLYPWDGLTYEAAFVTILALVESGGPPYSPELRAARDELIEAVHRRPGVAELCERLGLSSEGEGP